MNWIRGNCAFVAASRGSLSPGLSGAETHQIQLAPPSTPCMIGLGSRTETCRFCACGPYDMRRCQFHDALIVLPSHSVSPLFPLSFLTFRGLGKSAAMGCASHVDLWRIR